MKKLFFATGITFVAMSVFGNVTNQIPSEVTLNHRILSTTKCENSSCYFDFFNMTQEYGYGLSLEFGNDWGENKFSGVQVVDEIAIIADIGKMSCKNMLNKYETLGGGYPTKQDRKNNPMFWLSYSEDWRNLQRGGTSEIPALEGHCYLMYKTNSEKKIIVAFHVKSLLKNESVTIDEIELFQRAETVVDQ